MIDAATYAFSFVVILVFVRAGKRFPQDESSRGLFAGLRYVARDRILGPMMAAAAFINFTAQGLIAMLPVLVVRRFDADPKIVGFFFAAFGAGALAGSLIASQIVRLTRGKEAAAVRFGNRACNQQAQAQAVVVGIVLGLLEQLRHLLGIGRGDADVQVDAQLPVLGAHDDPRRGLAVRAGVFQQDAHQLGQAHRIPVDQHALGMLFEDRRRTGRAAVRARIVEQQRRLAGLDRAEQSILGDAGPVAQFVDHSAELSRLALDQREQFLLAFRGDLSAAEQIGRRLQWRQWTTQVMGETVEPL